MKASRRNVHKVNMFTVEKYRCVFHVDVTICGFPKYFAVKYDIEDCKVCWHKKFKHLPSFNTRFKLLCNMFRKQYLGLHDCIKKMIDKY